MDRQTSQSPKAHLESDKPYVPKDTLDDTLKAAVMGGAGGLFIAAVQNAMVQRNIGAFSVFTRGAPIIGLASTSRTSMTAI